MPNDDSASGKPDNVRDLRDGRWWHQWPIAVVLLGVVIALGLVGFDYFRRGAVVLAGSVLLAAFLRLLLPDREAGLLVVRSRRVDVAVLGTLGVLLAVFAFWVPPPR
jgi:hypothetical protein